MDAPFPSVLPVIKVRGHAFRHGMYSSFTLSVPMRRPFVAISVALWGMLHAQLVAPQLKTITMRDGLSSDHVQCMAMDQRGYLWIGTSDGLNRYDGKHVKVYRTGGSGSIPSDLILWMTVADDGLLYLGSSAPYLTILDPLADTLVNIPLPVPEFSTHGEQRANRIHIDRKKCVWVAHGARCLSRFDPATRKFTTVEVAPPMPTPRSREVIIGIHEDEQGILWLATFKGLVRFDPERMSSEPVNLHAPPGTPGDGYSFQIRGAVDDDSCLVIGTWSEGIFRMRKRDGEVRLLWPAPDHKPTFVDHMVQDMLRVEGGIAYVATIDQGLLRLDMSTGTVEHFDRSLSEEGCRKSQDLFTGAARLLRMDDALCIGSYSLGLALWSPRNNAVSAVQLPTHDTKEETDEVFAVHRDARTGELLVQTHHRGVFVFDSTGTTLLRQLHRPHPTRRYYQHLRLDADRVLMGSAPHAWTGSLSTGEMKRPHFLKEGTPCGGMIWWARGDGKNGLWCFTGAKGIHHVDTISGRCIAMADTLPDVARALGTWPWDIFTDRAGRQWFLSATSAPVVLHSDGRSERITGPASLAPFEVSDMAQTPDGRLWFAVKHTGIAMLDTGAQDIHALEDMSAQLASRNVTDIVAMQDGALWLTLPNALQHFDPATGRCRVITVVDGLPSGPLNFSTSHESLVPPLVVGTWEGFFSVRDEVLAPSPAPVVQITQMLALDSLVAVHLDRSSGKDLVLPYHLNRLTFFLRSTNLIDQQRDEFAYRLIGADTTWVNAGNEDRITFNSLSPGTYVFEVRARTAQGPWGGVTSTSFTILPPFWATWWFRSLMIVVLIAAAWLAFRAVLRARLRKQREQLERERALLEERMRIAHDLHDDLGSSLALIAMEGELARMDDGGDARDALRRVSEGAREVTDNMRRIVWALGSGQDTLGDLAAYIRSSAAELIERADMELDARVEIATPQFKLSADQRRHLLLITKELLLNVVKHAEARNATLLMAQQNGSLALTVTDDGRGFDTATRIGTGTGTTSMRERVKALGGTLDIRSAPGDGTTVEVKVPLTAPTV